MKRILGAALLVVAAACAKKQQPPSVQTAVVTRRDIIIDAQANGVIEPIAIIEVKSKAGGVITEMPVETGTRLRPGDLIAQIDTRDVQNSYDQAKAQLDAAETRLTVTENDRKRQEELFKARVITPQEFENVAVAYETAKTSVITARTNLDLRKQALEEATVKAPATGIVIDKTVSVGTVIAGANSSVSGGTTIIKMADLGTVRVRALFNEADIGNIHPGQPANVTVDAYPDRRFGGVVSKIEPQAVVQQNVTMFPVLVNLDNGESLLKPGMNGSISVLIDEHDGVIAVPNDAIKNPREAVATGAMLGLSADTINKELAAQGYNAGGNRGGFGPGGGGRRGGNGGGNGGNGGNGGGANRGGGTSGGDVAFAQQGGFGGGQQGGFGGGPQVSDEECKKIDDVLKAHPKQKKELDDLVAKMAALRPAGFGGSGRGGFGGGNPGGGDQGNRRGGQGGDSTRRRGGGDAQGGGRDSSARRGGGQGGMGGGGRGGSPEMQAISERMRAIYAELNIEQRTAGACRRRQGGGQNGAQTGGSNRQFGGSGQGGLTPSPEMNQRPQRTRQGLVFVSDSAKLNFQPRIVRLGMGNLDYTEVVDGIKEGERVVMLGALALQAQRQQQQDRMRQNATPLGGQQGPGGGGPGGPGGGGPGGGGGGGGRGGRGG